MKIAVLLLLASCTQVDRTTLTAPQPPTLDELAGAYAVTWNGAPAAGRIDGDVVSLEHFPCFLFSGQEAIGGTFDYDLAGNFSAEIKTPDGTARLALSGSFDSSVAFSGAYSVLVAGQPCESGAVAMRRTGK